MFCGKPCSGAVIAMFQSVICWLLFVLHYWINSCMTFSEFEFWLSPKPAAVTFQVYSKWHLALSHWKGTVSITNEPNKSIQLAFISHLWPVPFISVWVLWLVKVLACVEVCAFGVILVWNYCHDIDVVCAYSALITWWHHYCVCWWSLWDGL